MKAAIIGSGNVAEALAEAIIGMPHNGTDRTELVQICARSGSGRMLAKRLNVPFTDSFDNIADADIYILAVSDSAVKEVSEKLNIPPAAVAVHTAGGIGMDEISSSITNRGVLYPLQTFSKGRKIDFTEVPIFIEYNTPETENIIKRFAGSLSEKVYESDSALRTKIHTAAVFACNFTNHMYAIARDILSENGLSFDIVKPLIGETAAKALATENPAAMQTGPAVRNDMKTMERHLKILRDAERKDYEKTYKILSESIWETSKKTSQE